MLILSGLGAINIPHKASLLYNRSAGGPSTWQRMVALKDVLGLVPTSVTL